MSITQLPRLPFAAIAKARADTVRYVQNPQYWLLVASACLVTGYAGPFGTADLLPLVSRVLYWSALLGFAVLMQTYLSFVTYRCFSLHLGMHFIQSAMIAGLIGTPMIAGFVVVHYHVFIPHGPHVDLLRTILDVGVPVVILTVLGNIYAKLPPEYVDPRKPAQDVIEGATAAADFDADDHSPVLATLPPELGRDLISIQADNHHIEVRTTLGRARILMRLRDADRTLSGYAGGLRVHRSWWVNMAHVRDVELRRGGGAMLTLATGETVPVSRAMVETVAQVLSARERGSLQP